MRPSRAPTAASIRGRDSTGEREGGHREPRRHLRGDEDSSRSESRQPARPRDGSDREQGRISGRQVVGLTARQQEDARRQEVDHTEHAFHTSVRGADNAEPKAWQPHDRRERVHVQELAEGEERTRNLGEHPGANRPQKLERRPMILALPDDVRQHDEHRDEHTQPRPCGSELQAQARHHQGPDGRTEPRDQHRVLVERPETDNGPERQPPPPRPASRQAEQVSVYTLSKTQLRKPLCTRSPHPREMPARRPPRGQRSLRRTVRPEGPSRDRG